MPSVLPPVITSLLSLTLFSSLSLSPRIHSPVLSSVLSAALFLSCRSLTDEGFSSLPLASPSSPQIVLSLTRESADSPYSIHLSPHLLSCFPIPSCQISYESHLTLAAGPLATPYPLPFKRWLQAPLSFSWFGWMLMS
jgi:hypothetical protein